MKKRKKDAKRVNCTTKGIRTGVFFLNSDLLIHGLTTSSLHLTNQQADLFPATWFIWSFLLVGLLDHCRDQRCRGCIQWSNETREMEIPSWWKGWVFCWWWIVSCFWWFPKDPNPKHMIFTQTRNLYTKLYKMVSRSIWLAWSFWRTTPIRRDCWYFVPPLGVASQGDKVDPTVGWISSYIYILKQVLGTPSNSYVLCKKMHFLLGWIHNLCGTPLSRFKINKESQAESEVNETDVNWWDGPEPTQLLVHQR